MGNPGQCSEQQLTKIWGSKVHASIWRHQLRGDDLPYRPTQRRTVGHSHVLPPSMRTDDKAYGVMVRMIHKAASRMRQLDYCASRLIVRIDYIKQPTWEVTVKLSLTRDTMSFVHALAEAWPDHPPGRLYRVSIILTQPVATHSAPLPLFAGQTQSNKIANVMEKSTINMVSRRSTPAQCVATRKNPPPESASRRYRSWKTMKCKS